jgi:hypothetical protein
MQRSVQEETNMSYQNQRTGQLFESLLAAAVAVSSLWVMAVGVVAPVVGLA